MKYQFLLSFKGTSLIASRKKMHAKNGQDPDEFFAVSEKRMTNQKAARFSLFFKNSEKFAKMLTSDW